MRSFMIFLLLAIAAAVFVGTHQSRKHFRNNAVWVEDQGLVMQVPAAPVIEIPPIVRVSHPRVAVQMPKIHLTKRKANKEPGYQFAVDGWAPTTEEAKKDALDQATKVVTAALELQHATVEQSRLEKMITETQDGSEVQLGTSDGKELGAGKRISLTFELPSDYIQELGQQERGYRMEERMGWLSRGLAVLVAGLFAISGYVRLDEWSKGYFSGVLKVAAVFAVIASVVGVYFLR